MALLAATMACSGSPEVSSEPQPKRQSAYRRPANLNDGWKVDTPGDLGLDSIPLLQMVQAIESGQFSGVHSVLVARRGTLVFERYFDGPDARLDGEPTPDTFGPDTLHDVRSVTKSVTALLLGIAIERRLIPGIQAPISSFLNGTPPDEHRASMTLEHLLTMRSGITDDDVDTAATLPPGADPIWWTFDRPLRNPPGSSFEYSGGNTTLLRAAIERATGKPLDVFAREVLFNPLGVRHYEWMRWDDDSPRAAGGLRLRPRDMAKIGMVMASEGRWRGNQVVPRGWIRQTAVVRTVNEEDEAYGYHWWIQRHTSRGRQYTAIVALGAGGQRILAFDELDLVVVFTGGNYDDMASARLPELLVATHVLRAVRDVPRTHVAVPGGWSGIGIQVEPPR